MVNEEYIEVYSPYTRNWALHWRRLNILEWQCSTIMSEFDAVNND